MGEDDCSAAAIQSARGLLLSEPGGAREACEEACGRLSEGGEQVREAILSLLLIVTSRLLLRTDRMNGRMKRMLRAFSFADQRLVIPSSGRRLAAVYISAGDDAPVVLICHGIGELVEYWGDVQGLLKELGVSSLVFNYSGYGGSTGIVTAAHCEEDAVAAYRELVDRGHQSIVLLGFSLGSGVGCAVASRIDVDGLILCEGFSALREAGAAMGFPRWLTRVVPNVWDTVHRVGELEMPVLVVHSDEDGLFPLSMANRVAEACGPRGELIVVNGLTHNTPIFAPTETYWKPIVKWVKQRSSEALTGRLPVVRG
jgi:pimeloyl-ACP methyl ester carboxylesterase